MRRLLPILAVLAAAAASVAPSSAGIAVTRTVVVSDNAYSKSRANIRVNDSIEWTWDRTINLHNVTVDSGPTDFHSRTRNGTYAFNKKFRRKGTWKLHCTRHPGEMFIKVTVRSRN